MKTFSHTLLALSACTAILSFSAVIAETPFNINKADVKTLSSLKGIGYKKAQAIVNYRKKNGQFASAGQMSNIKGLSQKSVGRLEADNDVDFVTR